LPGSSEPATPAANRRPSYNERMRRSQKRLTMLMAAIPLLVIATALIYMAGMAALEKTPRDFWQSVEWSAETLSTTGYGADSSWAHPLMVVYVVLVQFIGVFLVFLIVPIYLVPFLEERFEERLPRRAPDHIDQHVVVYKSGPAVEMLLGELRSRDVPFVVVETEEAKARALVEQQITVVYISGDEDVMAAARISTARTLVANGRDEENGAMILRSRQMGFTGHIYALVENPAHRRPMELAGATAAYTPRHIVAAALAARASDQISSTVTGIQHIEGFSAAEFRIREAGPLAGKSIAESGLEEQRITVVGHWVNGDLSTHCHPHTLLQPRSIIVVIGPTEHIARSEILREGARRFQRRGPFHILGFGEVGQKVKELLTDAGEEAFVIDRTPHPGVDLVGNVLDPSVLERADFSRASGAILALDTDDATLFSTVILRDLAAEIPIIARVNHAGNVENIYRAGADFALSISEVSGRMLSHRILGTRAGTEAHLSIRSFPVPGLTGLPIAAWPAVSGASAVALRRDQIILPISDATPFMSGDQLFFCGSDEALKEIERQLQGG
jgi:Trk K+ transport system NAD-binding subunit